MAISLLGLGQGHLDFDNVRMLPGQAASYITHMPYLQGEPEDSGRQGPISVLEKHKPVI